MRDVGFDWPSRNELERTSVFLRLKLVKMQGEPQKFTSSDEHSQNRGSSSTITGLFIVNCMAACFYSCKALIDTALIVTFFT